MSNTQDQAGKFLTLTQHIPDPPPAKGDEIGGKVPFRSSLQLTADQESRLVEKAMHRLSELENESGRTTVIANTQWFESSQNLQVDRWTFMGRRSIFEATYQNKMEWRKWLVGGIFVQSNLVAPFSRRICRQMTAEANHHFFGTDPWFTAFPIGADRAELANELDSWSQFRIGKSGLRATLAMAIENAFVRGESIVKTTYVQDEQIYQEQANILIDGQGKAILDVNGDYILDTDHWVPQLDQGGKDPQTGLAISRQPTGLIVLKKDGQTPQPANLQYEPKLIRRRMIRYEGARSEVVYWRDILVPQAATSIQDADCVIHLSDLPVIKLISLYQKKGLLNETPGVQYENTQRALQMLRAMASESGQAKSAVTQARPDIGESYSYVGNYQTEPTAQIAECWMRFDANEDGDAEDIMVVIDRKNRIPVFYDYLPNVTPDGERPFDVVRGQGIDGRWYGLGAMEMFESSQIAIDLMLNRTNIAQSASGRVTFWNPSNVLEGDSNPNLLMNWGQSYTLKPGKKKEDAVQYETLPDTKSADLREMMQYFQQIMVTESGVANTNDGASAGLDTAKLATGVRDIQSSGDIMIALYLAYMEPSLTSILKRHLKIEISNMKPEEVFAYFEGDLHKIGVLKQVEVQDLDFDVDILLTSFRSEQLLQEEMQAANLAAQYFQYTPDVQQKLAPLYRQLLKTLKIDSADEIIVPTVAQPLPTQPSPIPAQVGPPKAGAPPQLPPPGEAPPATPPPAPTQG